MYHAHIKDILPLVLTDKKIGGVTLEGKAELRVMIKGEHIQLVALKLDKGYYHPLHNHPEHESVGYVVSGRLEMRVGEEELVLDPGSSWYHPKGVFHSTRALELTEAVEIHTPPRSEYA
jgi:quercetin dioxygenase-like cupin family protein